MDTARSRLTPSGWLRLPRRTARLRLTVLYGGLVFVAGGALLASTYALFERATRYKSPQLPRIPHAPTLTDISPLLRALNPFASAAKPGSPFGALARNHILGPARVGRYSQQVLIRDQHRLAQAVHQLTGAVHQLAEVGPAQAAQRAADSHQLLINSGIALALVGVLAVLAGWLIAGRMLRPIRTMTRTARRISSESLHERLALDGPDDELKELGDTLDGLFTRLEAAFDAQRHFVANASHELRTPLTAERTLLQVALDDPDTTPAAWRATAQQVLASNAEHARLIEALLALAGSQRELDGREPVDLASTVTTTLTDLQPEIDRLGLHLEQAISAAPLDGDPVLVRRLASNLLENAVRHNTLGGRVEVVTAVKQGEAFLSVANTGPLIPAADVERLFQPFQRLDPRRTHHKDGHGIGLSVVQAIAHAHHAELHASARPHGGLTVEVSFPPAAGINSQGTFARARTNGAGDRAHVA